MKVFCVLALLCSPVLCHGFPEASGHGDCDDEGECFSDPGPGKGTVSEALLQKTSAVGQHRRRFDKDPSGQGELGASKFSSFMEAFGSGLVGNIGTNVALGVLSAVSPELGNFLKGADGGPTNEDVLGQMRKDHAATMEELKSLSSDVSWITRAITDLDTQLQNMSQSMQNLQTAQEAIKEELGTQLAAINAFYKEAQENHDEAIAVALAMGFDAHHRQCLEYMTSILANFDLYRLMLADTDRKRQRQLDKAAILNGGFEIGPATTTFSYGGQPQYWSVSGLVPKIRSGNGAWGGTTAADGDYFYGLQHQGASIWQVVSNHKVDSWYQLSFYAAGRFSVPPPTLEVKIAGVSKKITDLGDSTFQLMRVAYKANTADIEIRFENASPSGDRTAFVDAVSIATTDMVSLASQENARFHGMLSSMANVADFQHLLACALPTPYTSGLVDKFIASSKLANNGALSSLGRKGALELARDIINVGKLSFEMQDMYLSVVGRMGVQSRLDFAMKVAGELGDAVSTFATAFHEEETEISFLGSILDSNIVLEYGRPSEAAGASIGNDCSKCDRRVFYNHYYSYRSKEGNKNGDELRSKLRQAVSDCIASSSCIEVVVWGYWKYCYNNDPVVDCYLSASGCLNDIPSRFACNTANDPIVTGTVGSSFHAAFGILKR